LGLIFRLPCNRLKIWRCAGWVSGWQSGSISRMACGSTLRSGALDHRGGRCFWGWGSRSSRTSSVWTSPGRKVCHPPRRRLSAGFAVIPAASNRRGRRGAACCVVYRDVPAGANNGLPQGPACERPKNRASEHDRPEGGFDHDLDKNETRGGPPSWRLARAAVGPLLARLRARTRHHGGQSKELLDSGATRAGWTFARPKTFAQNHLEAAQNWPFEQISARGSSDTSRNGFKENRLPLICDSGPQRNGGGQLWHLGRRECLER